MLLVRAMPFSVDGISLLCLIFLGGCLLRMFACGCGANVLLCEFVMSGVVV